MTDSLSLDGVAGTSRQDRGQRFIGLITQHRHGLLPVVGDCCIAHRLDRPDHDVTLALDERVDMRMPRSAHAALDRGLFVDEWNHPGVKGT